MALKLSLTDLDLRPDEIRHIVAQPSDWDKLPLLNVVPNHELHDHQLVRFRGMIQHMYNPEFYLGQYEVVHTATNATEKRSGRYRDIIQCSPDEKLEDSSKNVIEERQVLYCITTPALNDWVQQQEIKMGTIGRIFHQPVSEKSTSITTAKRPAEHSESMEVENFTSHDSSSSSAAEANCHSAKRLSNDTSRGDSQAQCPSAHLSLNFPIDGSRGLACILKTYEADDIPPLKLNDVVDVVGFLSLDPSLSQVSSGMGTEAENLAENPPPSIVPRLHALAVQKLTHVNVSPSNLDEIYNTAENVRKELHLVLTQMLLGDSLAADYLICHLISIVYMRKDGLALGHFSMNLSNLPQRPDYTRLLYSVLERILPKSHYLAMTLDNMNTLSFIPKMDYQANRLSSGLLQLSDNTHLVVDETRLEAGKLDTAGVNNVQALRTLISHQVVNYDFQYYSKPYDADVPVLILSEGKSLLPSDVLVPLKVDPSCLNTLSEIFQAANHFLRDPLLSAIRMYLCTMKHSSYEFPDDLQKKAQEDFVEMRRVGGPNVSADDLHLLLVLARLVSLSNGDRTVSLKAWEQAKRMEDERKNRFVDRHGRPVQPSNEP